MDYKYTTPGPYASIVDGALKSGDSLEIDNTLSKSVLYIANLGSSAIIRPSGIVPSAGQSMSIDGKLTINLLAPTAMVNIIQGGGPPAVGNVSANLRIGTQGVIIVNGSGPDSRAMFGGATTTAVIQNQGAINISNSSLYGCKVSNYVSGIGGAASNPRGKINLSGVYLQGGGKYPFSLLSQTSTFNDISYQDISMNNSSIYLNTISNSTISLSGSNNYIGFGNSTAPGTLSPVKNLVIRGFGAGDILDIPSQTSTDTWNYNSVTGILTIQSVYGTKREISVDIGLGYDPALFSAVPLPSGNKPAGETQSSGVTYNGPTPCYLAGTLISTPKGNIPIEYLGNGDEIYVFMNGERRIKKIGLVARGIASIKHTVSSQPDLAGYPVRVAQGALGDGIPFADTYVTPEHCLFIDEHLIPARLLINGRTIAYALHYEQYDFYHLILDDHAIICANGMLSETLYRAHSTPFDATETREARRGAARRRAAPLGTEPSFVRKVSRKYGCSSSLEPPRLIRCSDNFFDSVFLMTRGRMIRPLRKKGRNLVFTIPDAVSQVVLHSPALRPCDAIGAYWDDRRSLGMLVGNISLFDSDGYSALEEHHELGMRLGWNGYENAHARWTSGETPINFPLRAASSLGILTLEIHDTCYDAVERILRAESGSNAA